MTTEQLSEVPNPHSHQPASCLYLRVTHWSFWAFSSITFLGPQIINIASDQIFHRLPPFHHKWPSHGLLFFSFSTSLTSIFHFPSSFPCSFNDATYVLPLPFLPLLFLVLTISFLSLHRWFNMRFSHLFHRLRFCSPLVFPSALSFLYLILKLHSTKSKQKVGKNIKHWSIHCLVKFSSRGLANSLRRTIVLIQVTHLSSKWLHSAVLALTSLAQTYCCALRSWALLSVYNVNTA